MNKKFLPLAVAAAMAAPMAAQAQDVTLYGKAHVALSHYSGDLLDTIGGDAWDLTSNSSRFGIKGSEDLGNGMKAIFKMEFQVRLADTVTTSIAGNNEAITNRNGYVGLAADWGTFLMGRHDTPLKISTGSLDLFGDTVADYNAGSLGYGVQGGLNGVGLGFLDARADNAIAYVSPNMNGLTIAAAIVPTGKVAVIATNTAANGLAEAYSVAAIYSNGPFFASLAYEDYSDDAVNAAANTGLELTRLGLGYTANNFHVGFVYEDQESGAASPLGDAEKWQLSGSYTFGNNVVKAMYGDRNGDAVTWDAEQWAIGIDHNLSKRTKVYAVYTDVDTNIVNGDWSALSAGMVTNF